jgi:hypothetical protein
VNAPIGILNFVENVNALDCGALSSCIKVFVDFEINTKIAVKCCGMFARRLGKVVGSSFVNAV